MILLNFKNVVPEKREKGQILMWSVAVSVVTDIIFKANEVIYMIALIIVLMILIAICFYCLGYIAKELIFYRTVLRKQKRKDEDFTYKNNY